MSLYFSLSPLSPAVILAAAALLGVWLPAARAARLDSLEGLQLE